MQTKLLWKLQEVDRELLKISREIKQKELVLSLKEKQIKIQELQGVLDNENFEITQLEKKVYKLEQKLSSLEEKKKEQEDKLYSGDVNIPKELAGMRDRLAESVNKISKVEENMLEYMDKIEDKVQVVNQTSGELEELQKEYYKGVKKYQKNKKIFEQNKYETELKQMELKKRIEKELLDKYHKMQKQFKNTAIARVQNGLCSGCRIEIPIIQLKSIKEGNNIKYCEHCGRILIEWSEET